MSVAFGRFVVVVILLNSLPIGDRCAYAAGSPTKDKSGRDQGVEPAVPESTEAKQGLKFSLGNRGLDSLSFNGQPFFVSPQNGELRPAKSLFRKMVDAVFNTPPPTATRGREKDAVDLKYPWGTVSCAYSKRSDNGLTIQIQVANDSAEEISDVSLRLFELNFPSVPAGVTLEAGMFGSGFKGETYAVYQHPLLADPEFVAPVMRMDYDGGTLNFCADDLESSIGIPFSTNSPVSTRYPFEVTCPNVAPASTRTFSVSLRFGKSGSSMKDLSSDVLKGYAKKYRFEVNWKDHRPIGAIYLASTGVKSKTNPRRWILNGGKIDITNDDGRAGFRTALLKLADESVEALKAVDAQGMITWDPEGQEFLDAIYYGDPRLVQILAPEMEYKSGSETNTVNEYFERFRDAGLKVGVCIRPQQIKMLDGKPVQQAADDEYAAQILKSKIAYAKKRWGCTLFYVDSTYTGPRPLNPEVFKTVAEAYPDVLLIPENESMRYFAYSAPLNSYVNHKVTSTPVGTRLVYPGAFSVLLAPGGDEPEDHDALVVAVRNGDILLFNGWYKNPGAMKIKALYEEASREKPAPRERPHLN
jgi:hypothetical protein